MAVVTPTLTSASRGRRAHVFAGGSSTSDNEVLLDIEGTGYNEYIFGAGTGVVDVQVSVDGTNFLTAPASLVDLGATTGAFVDGVTATVANRAYKLCGAFARVRFMQSGATAVTGFGVVAR